MAEREKIQLFNDGSKAFKLLCNELKDTKDLIVKDVEDDTNILEWFTKADTNIKTYLHFTADDLRDNKEQKRRAIEKVERLGFKNKVVLPYEGMDNRTVDQRFNKLPIIKQYKVTDKEVKEVNKDYIKKTGKRKVPSVPKKPY